MKIWDGMQMAGRSLRGQPMKAFFMGMGVTIGVAFLITIAGVVQGLGAYVEGDVLGKLLIPNSFIVRTQLPRNRRPPTPAEQRAFARRTPMTVDEVARLVATLPPDARWATENFTTGDVRVPETGRHKSSWVFAVRGQSQRLKSYEAAKGRLLTDAEIERGAAAVILGPDLAEALFPGLDPVGRSVRLGGTAYTVMGVTVKQGSVLGISLDKFLMVSHQSPAGRLTGKAKEIQSLTVQMPTRAGLTDAEDAIRTTFRQIRGQGPGDPDIFTIETNEDALDFVTKIKGYLNYAAVGLPAVSLLVGGIIILNIMLMVVLERTREIGVRKALGATRRDIIFQFLAEATLVAIIGSIIGITLGNGALAGVRVFTPLTGAAAPWWALGVSVVVGGGTGIMAGVLPATRAARLDPIAALRQE